MESKKVKDITANLQKLHLVNGNKTNSEASSESKIKNTQKCLATNMSQKGSNKPSFKKSNKNGKTILTKQYSGENNTKHRTEETDEGIHLGKNNPKNRKRNCNKSKDQTSTKTLNPQKMSNNNNRKKNSKHNWRARKSCASNLFEKLKSFKETNKFDVEEIKKMFKTFHDDSSKDSMIIADIISLLCNICSTSLHAKADILESVYNKVFMKAVQIFMLEKSKECIQSCEGKEKCEVFFQNFIELSRSAIELEKPIHLLSLKHALTLTKSVLTRLKGKLNISPEQFNFREMLILIEERMKKSEIEKETVSIIEINEMKTMSILPTKDDLLGKAPDLKKNIIEGAYKSVEHYLTVQFKLLHEDFTAPLREGITEYLSSLNKGCTKKTGIIIYRDVRVLGTSIESGKFGHIIKLDRKTKWAVASQFFIFGSLLLFTNDDFNSFFLGTVIDLNRGSETITVKLNGHHNTVCEDIYAHNFVMAASKVFFEPYFHVLTALQNMKANEFPMEKYIVQVNPDPKPPAYIKNLGLSTYELFGETKVEISDTLWPTLCSVKFNPSQQRAFQAALTNEFVAIQGPPGTGKTFLGLQIVTTLLDNVGDETPILIVCYKNHALDQFLEGIMKKTTKIIRIGGRSKNENLKKFNLKELRQRYGYNQFEKVLKELASSYFRKQYYIDGLRKDGIVSLKNLLQYIPCYKFREEIMYTDYVEWLMEGVYADQEGDLFDEMEGEAFDYMQTESNNSESLTEVYVNGVGNDISESEINDTFIYENKTHINECRYQDPTNLEISSQIEENRFRLEQIFIDDYSNVYQEVKNEIFNQEANFSRSTLFSDIPEFQETIQELKYHCKIYKTLLEELMNSDGLVEEEKIQWRQLYEDNIDHLQRRISFLKRMMPRNPRLSEEQIDNLYKVSQQFSIWSLTNWQRWALYNSWLTCLAKDIKKEMIDLEEQILFEERNVDEQRNMADKIILQKAEVVGMTTTGAAKLRPMLNELGAKIVVIEEAAEVLESHIVSALSSQCQHVILIGDHKQLRPNPAVYKLCTKYNFDISLFERMVKNGLNCHVLNVQHRMRPEFASLIVPAIYPTLSNHPSTEKRPDIRGVCTNLYFVNHNHFEEQIAESTSHSNKHEAQLVVQLALYLLQQGYSTSDITILATYTGQVKQIIKLRDQKLRDIRVSTVDDFQGEESKIIILSLVRSNEEKRIGFLKIENRVCVALSRAREGFYIFGNMDFLAENSEIWPKVKERLLQVNALGDSLSVYCQNHPDTITNVRGTGALKELPEGGCKLKCTAKLGCGHACRFYCHPLDQEHQDKYLCSYPCERKICDKNHLCPLVCGRKCSPCKKLIGKELPCGHSLLAACSSDINCLKCITRIPFTLPCGHEINRCCGENLPLNIVCKQLCGKQLPCSHPCAQKCHGLTACVTSNNFCQVEMEINLKCGHQIVAACYRRDAILCTKKVDKTYSCGHTNSVDCCTANISMCETKVEKTLKCGHTQEVCCSTSIDLVVCHKTSKRTLQCGHVAIAKCSLSSDYIKCQENCSKTLACGHQCKAKCSELCVTKKCEKLVQSNNKPICGHGPVMAPCHLNTLGPVKAAVSLKTFCLVVCDALLLCGHRCKGLCKDCSNQHVACNEPCTKTLPCGHKCTKMCKELCAPCYDKCQYRCGHGQCNSICGEPCMPCKKPCLSRCVHKRCTRPCFFFCNRRSCPLPCPLPLSCGHLCMGLCGEVCPRLCIQCDPETVQNVGGHAGSRFIVLEDCGHVIEVARVDAMFPRNSSCLALCPVESCRKPIITTKRYLNEIRIIFNNMVRNKRALEAKMRMEANNNHPANETHRSRGLELRRNDPYQNGPRSHGTRQGYSYRREDYSDGYTPRSYRPIDYKSAHYNKWY